MVSVLIPTVFLTVSLSGCFQDFFLVLSFQSLIMMCLDKDLFWFILFGVFLASGICMFMSVVKLGKFLATISSGLCQLQPYSSPFITVMAQYWIFCPIGLGGSVHFPLFFLCISGWLVFIVLPSNSQLLLLSPLYLAVKSTHLALYFGYCIFFSVQKFPFGSPSNLFLLRLFFFFLTICLRVRDCSLKHS